MTGVRNRLVILGGLLSSMVCHSVWAADAGGLDLTIEVLGRNDRVDERIVNRIAVPGVEGDRGGIAAAPPPPSPRQGIGSAVGETVKGVSGLVKGVMSGVIDSVAPPVPVPVLRYDEWVEERREAERERQRESREWSR